MSGQLVNLSKSSIYFSSNVPLARKEEVMAYGFFGKCLALYLFGCAFTCGESHVEIV